MIEKEDFTALLYVENLTEAEKYKTILEDHDVPAEIADSNEEDGSGHDDDLLIQVPREYLEEARHILRQRKALGKEFGVDYNDFDDPDDYDEDVENYEESGLDHEMILDDIEHFDDELDDDDDGDDTDYYY